MKKHPDQDIPAALSGADTGNPASQTATISNALRCEIAFWEELLQRFSQTVPAESVERMEFALELAERKLKDLHEDPAAAHQQNTKSDDDFAGKCKIHYLPIKASHY